MRNLFFGLIAAIIFFSCAAKKKKTPSPYFNGVIEYTLKAESGSPKIDSAIYKYLGNTMTAYIQDSLVARVYSKGSLIVEREITRVDLLKIYHSYLNSDTISVVDISSDATFSNISFNETGMRSIAGINCLGLNTVNKYWDHILKDPETMVINYWFDTSKHLSPAINKGVKYGGYEHLFSKYNYLTVASEQIFGEAKISFTAIKITEHPVDSIMFAVPRNKIEVNLFLRKL